MAKIRCSALAATIYNIWTVRTRAIFEGEKVDVEDMVRRIKIMVFRCFPSSTDQLLKL